MYIYIYIYIYICIFTLLCFTIYAFSPSFQRGHTQSVSLPRGGMFFCPQRSGGSISLVNNGRTRALLRRRLRGVEFSPVDFRRKPQPVPRTQVLS